MKILSIGGDGPTKPPKPMMPMKKPMKKPMKNCYPNKK